MKFKKLEKKPFLLILFSIFSLFVVLIPIVEEKNELNEDNSYIEKQDLSQKAFAAMPDRDALANYDFTSWNNHCSPNLVVINKNNKISDNLNLSLCKHENRQVHVIIKSSLDNMIRDAKKGGINLRVSSGYRSPEVQRGLFNEKVSTYIRKKYPRSKAEELAAARVARPYTSEHNAGLAVDLNGVNHNFHKTKTFKWLINNSANYGFILRYNNDKIDITHVIFEPWHFRYVGAEHAKIIQRKNMCLEEYVAYLINK